MVQNVSKLIDFGSSFDLLEDVLTVPYNIITFYFFYSQKIKKKTFSNFLQILQALKKMELLRRKKIISNFLVFFGHGDFEYCTTADSHANLIISGKVHQGLHGHTRQGGFCQVPSPYLRLY